MLIKKLCAFPKKKNVSWKFWTEVFYLVNPKVYVGWVEATVAFGGRGGGQYSLICSGVYLSDLNSSNFAWDPKCVSTVEP